MAKEVMLEVLQEGITLPYVGPVCAAIQNILDMKEACECVREACTEDIPKELHTLQITLSLLPETIGSLKGDAKELCDCHLRQLGDHIVAMQQTVTTFNKRKKKWLFNLLTAKSQKSRIEELEKKLTVVKQDVILILAVFNGGNRDVGRQPGDGYSSCELLARAKELDRIAESRRMVDVLDKLEREYCETMLPCMEKLQAAKERMESVGGRYAMAVIIPPVRVTAEERADMFKSMRTLGRFWKNIQKLYASGTDIFHGSKNWAGRGMMYRMLVEPLDIANWYFGNKNLESGHYIDDITEHSELVDNHRRPGRYFLLQKIEIDVLKRTPASSLGTARELRDILQNDSWETLAPIDGPHS